jgi:hypothetical protein
MPSCRFCVDQLTWVATRAPSDLTAADALLATKQRIAAPLVALLLPLMIQYAFQPGKIASVRLLVLLLLLLLFTLEAALGPCCFSQVYKRSSLPTDYSQIGSVKE